MSTKPPITCFNNEECIYGECTGGLFSEELDGCMMEARKTKQPQKEEPSPLDTTEVIIGKILLAKPGLTKVSIQTLIDAEIAKASGLLTEEAAAHLVASNLGVYAEEESDVTLALKDYVNDLDFSEAPQIISPKKFMGDKWGGVMEILRPLGYGWVRDGRNSRWEAGKAQPRERDLSGFGKSATDVDVSEIEWKVKDGDETVEARSGEKAWAFVMGYDRDAGKSTEEPKYSTQALHDYLQQTDHYCDGVYVYFMNKEASFFSRDPIP